MPLRRGRASPHIRRQSRSGEAIDCVTVSSAVADKVSSAVADQVNGDRDFDDILQHLTKGELDPGEAMNKSVKLTQKLSASAMSSTKRHLFAELVEGLKALAEARQSKRKLRTRSMQRRAQPHT